MRIDWWTLGLQAVNVLVLLWILKRFLFKPVAAAIAARQGAATALLEQAEAARRDAEEQRTQAQAELARQAADRQQRLQAVADEAEAERRTLLEQARAEAERLRTGVEAELARTRVADAAAEADRASRLAVTIAAKLLDRLPAEARVAGFVEGLAQAVASLPAETRAELAASGSLRLRAPRDLTETEQQACRAALGRVLGHPVEIVVEPLPTLIAGLELDAPHAVVRNSFRADLDRILAELTPHDRR